MNRPTRFLITLLAASALVTIAGCSSAPISINILPFLGSYASGAQGPATIPPGSYSISTYYPSSTGYQINIPNSYPNATSASLSYAITLELSGLTPPISGSGAAQMYLAPAYATNPVAPAYALGRPISLNFTRTDSVVQGAATLDPTQLAAVNDHQLIFTMGVSGSLDSGGGQLTVHYLVTQFELSFGLF